MTPLDRDRFIALFKESYKCRDIIASLNENMHNELTRMLGQTEELSWFDGAYFANFYEHVHEVYYYADNSVERGIDDCFNNDEWACLVKLDNGFYFFMDADTDLCSGFTNYGGCRMFASRDLDWLLTYGLSDRYRGKVSKVQ